MIKRYLLYTIPDFALCLICAVCLCINIVQGFKLTDQMRGAYAMFIAVTAVVLALLYIVRYGKKTKIIGIPCLFAAAAVLILMCYRMGYPLIETDIRENNGAIAYLIVIVTALVTWIAARAVLGAMFYALIGMAAHAWLCLCDYTFSVPALIIFIWSAGVLYLYARYRKKILSAHAPRHSFRALVGTSAAVMAVVLLICGAAWFGGLSGWERPALDPELIERVVSIEVLEKLGISKKQELTGDEYARYPDKEHVTESSETADEYDNEEEGSAGEQESEQPEGGGSDSDNPFLSFITNPAYTVAGIAVGLFILIIVIAFLIACGIARYLLRHRIWLNKAAKEDREIQAEKIYRLLRKKFRIMRIYAPASCSPVEYAKQIQNKTEIFDEGGASWEEISESFGRLIYGKITPGNAEYDTFISYYKHFWKSCRKHCGFRYLWKQFRL